MTSTEMVVSERRSLDELSDVVRREHGLAMQAAASAVMHAIAAGEALIEAQETLDRERGRGQWAGWVADQGLSKGNAALYMRIAYYREHVLGSKTIDAARLDLRGLPAISGRTAGLPGYPEWMVEEARSLQARGVTQAAVAERLGVGKSTVQYWLMSLDERRARKRANSQRERDKTVARRAAAREAQRQQLIATATPPVAEAYSMIRKTAQVVDRARAGAEDRVVKAALAAAYAKLTKAEDEIVRALGAAS